MTIRTISGPVGLPVDLAKLKVHCRINSNLEDALLTSYLKAAMTQFEEHTGRQVLTATLEMTLPRFPSSDYPLRILKPPFGSLVSVSYKDTAGDVVTLDDAETVPGDIFTSLVPAPDDVWPDVYTTGRGDEVAVRFTAGYGAAPENVPDDLQLVLMMLVGHWNETRELGDVPDSIKNLWAPYETAPAIATDEDDLMC